MVVEVAESRFDDIAPIVVGISATAMSFLRFHGWADLVGLAGVVVVLLNLRTLWRTVITVTASALSFRGQHWAVEEIESVHLRKRSFWRSSAVTVRLKDGRGDVYLPAVVGDGHRSIATALEDALSRRAAIPGDC